MPSWVDRLIKCLMVCRIKCHTHCVKTCCCGECESDCMKSGLSREPSTDDFTPAQTLSEKSKLK